MKRLLLSCALICCTIGLVMAQRTITGTVTDNSGEPLIGASVVVKGTTIGTITDVDGQYALEVPETANSVVFSYTGYGNQEVELGASDVVDVVLSFQSEVLEDIVVTALGFETSREKVGTASSQVDGEALVRSGEVGLINSLAGKSAGVNIVANSGDPGAGSKIQIRGASSITGDLQPLIIVDGIPIFNDSYYGEGFGGQNSASSGSIGSGGGVTQQSRLNDLNPEDIESVEVLRGASAAAVWGSRAANGVIVITTKKGKYQPGKRFDINFNASVAFDEINKEVPLNREYGRGNDMQFQFVPGGGRSWGDKISERAGGQDAFITDPNAEGYQGMFVANSGNTYYAIPNGTPENPSGGKNSQALYDPYEMLFKTGVTYATSLGLGTAGENGSTYFSIANLSQDGIVKNNSTYNRTTVRLNATRNIGNLFSINANTAYTYTNSDRVQMGSNLNGLFLGGLRSAVDFNDEDYEGTFVDAEGAEFAERQRAYRNPLGANTTSIYDNPLWMMNNIMSNSRVNRFLSKLELRFDPLSWLNFTARGGLDTYTDEREDFYPVLSAGTNNGGRFTKETITRRQLNFDFIGRARWNITDVIAADFLLGVGINERKLDDHGTTSRAFINPLSPPQLGNATNLEVFNIEETIRTAGIYGTIGLELFNQLYVNVSARNDWLSTLPQQNNSVFYPAVDVAWQFSELLPANAVLSSGKLRGGWGQVGRGPDPYLTRTNFYTPTAANIGYGEGWGPGVNPIAYGGAFPQSTVAGNPNIKPEIKTEIEAGADLGFWNDRIGLAFTYYDNITEDLIIQVETPESSGFTSQIANAAEVKNNGIELELDLAIIRRPELNWNIYGNFTRNRNEVTKMAGTESISISGFAGTSSRAVLGQQLGVLWGAKWDREEDGSLILDEDGFPTLANAAGVIGDPNPDYRMGIGSALNWKGFSVNLLFDFSQGGDIWNGTRGALAFFGMAGYTTEETILTPEQANALKIYTGETVAERYPFRENGDGTYTVRGKIDNFGGDDVFLDETWYRIGPGSGFTGPDEQFVEDASWARLRELTLAYNFGEQLTNVPWLQGASLAFTGRNLFLWTDYTGNDPDTNLTGSGLNGLGLDYFQNPSSRTYKVTLNLAF